MAREKSLKTIKKEQKFEKFLISHPKLTYNQAWAKCFKVVGGGQAKLVHDRLVEEGRIQNRNKKIHITENRKPRVPVDKVVVKNFIAVSKKNPTAKIAKLGKILGISHGAAYNVHDRLVAEGKIKTHRVVMTVTASEPPLFVRAEQMAKYIKKNPDCSYAELGRKFGCSGETAKKYWLKLEELGLV